MREVVKYSKYKRFGSSVKITFDGQEIEKDKPDAAPAGNPPPAPPAQPPH